VTDCRTSLDVDLYSSDRHLRFCAVRIVIASDNFDFIDDSSVKTLHNRPLLICWFSTHTWPRLVTYNNAIKRRSSTLYTVPRKHNLRSNVDNSTMIKAVYTQWLKLKYPTVQNAISRHFYTQFLGLYGRDPATILNFKKYFSFLQSCGYINILWDIFDSARNNQQQLVIFIQVMVSAGDCFGGKERLHLIPYKTKVETLLPELVQDCRFVLPSGFIFQQDGAPALTAKVTQDWLLPTAVNSLVKMNGLRTRLTSTLWTAMSGELCLNATNHFNPGAVLRWARGGTGPPNVGQPPPQYFGSNSKNTHP